MDYISICLSGAAFILAVFGPAITAGITCLHETRMYKKRFVTEHRHEAIENYLKAAGRCLFTDDPSKELQVFGEVSSEIFMYAPKALWDDIRKLNEMIIQMSNAEVYQQTQALREATQEKYLELCENFYPMRRGSKNKHVRLKNKRN